MRRFRGPNDLRGGRGGLVGPGLVALEVGSVGGRVLACRAGEGLQIPEKKNYLKNNNQSVFNVDTLDIDRYISTIPR